MSSIRLKTKSGIPDLKCTTNVNGRGNFTVTDVEKAEVVSDFFSSVQAKDETTSLDLNRLPLTSPMTDELLTNDEVLKYLKRIKTSKSPGPDGIHPRIIYELPQQICVPITKLFNVCISKGEVPSDWKQAIISPLFKKNDTSDPNNYRPVSVTSILCKVLERCIRDRIVEHMRCNNYFSQRQFGFISGRSTTLQLLHVLEKWTKALGHDCIYFDFDKAFDKVSHVHLLAKLRRFNTTELAIQWII